MPDTVTLTVKETGDTFVSHLYVDEECVAANCTLSPETTQAQRDLADEYLSCFEPPGRPRVEEHRLAAIGEGLFETWLADDWEDDVRDALTPPDRNRFIVASNVPAVLNLPWSLLRLPSEAEPVGLDPTSSVRLHPATDRLAERDGERRPGPLRVLYSACAPRDAGDLGYEEEEYQLVQTLSQRERVAHFGCDLGRFDEFQDRVREYNPHVVHLTGHGVVTDGEGHFAFEDEEGYADLQSSNKIVNDALAGRGVQCVFVSGCETGQAPAVRAVNGLCQGLVRSGVPMAVGWAASILDGVATEFGDTFYAELSAGEDVDRAVVQARRDARQLCRERVDEDGWVDPSWTLPVLYTATTQADLFDPTRHEDPPKPSVAQDPLPGMTEGHAAYFIGRRREQQRLLPTLRSGDLNTVLLTGLGGVGKSTLATRLARRLQSDGFGPIAVPSPDDDSLTAGRLIDRCFEVFLAEEADGPYSQLRSEEIELRDKLRLLVRILNQNRFTLVLDNFEQNVDRASREILDDTLAWFLPYLVENLTGDGRCLVTSRYRPADLEDALPPVATEVSLTDFPESAFFKYLLDDEVIKRRYRSGDLPRALLSRVYDLLGGTPRFLEQVREALREMPANALADALDDVDLPTESDADENHLRELHDAYVQDLFVDQLYVAIKPPDARTALSRAAVYTIPMTAEGFAAAADVGEDMVWDWLDEWRRCTFIVPIQSDDADEELWGVPTLLRPWLLDRLDESERQQAHEAAGDFLENLRSTNRWTELRPSPFEIALESRTQYLEADQFEGALSVSDDVFKVLSANGMDREVYRLSQELLQYQESPIAMNWSARALSGMGEVNEADHWFEQAISASDSDSPTYATAKHGKGALRFSTGKIMEGRELLRQAISVRQELGNRSGEASSRQVLGSSYATQGKFEKAREQFDKSLTLLEDIEDAHAQANTMKEIASLERQRGNFDGAKQKYLDALDVFQQLGDRSLEAHVIHELGSLYLNQQKLGTASEWFESALELCQEINNRRGEALALHQLAAINYRSGNFGEARKGYDRAIDIYKTVGMRRELGAALHDLGLILKEDQGDTRKALQKFLTALALRQEVGDQPGEATTLSVIGTIAWETGARVVGIELMILGYDLMEQLGHHDARKLKDQAEMYLCRQYFLQTGVDLSVEEMRERAQSEYSDDRAWGLIHEAFPDPKFPDGVLPN
jgi:tetratricopeptide (TPR) repeat protein